MPPEGRYGPKPKKTTSRPKNSPSSNTKSRPKNSPSSVKKTKPKANIQSSNPRRGGGGADPMPTSTQVSKPSPISKPSNPKDFFGSLYTAPPKVDTGIQARKDAAQFMMDAGISNLGGKPIGGTLAGTGGINEGKFTIGAGDIPPVTTADTTVDTTVDPKEKERLKLEKEKKDNAKKTAQGLTDWWADPKNQKGKGRYKERKNIFTGKLSGSQEAVTEKLQDKLNKGFYKIVQGPKGQPLIIHASTGIPVNPYTGNIISTQTRDDQGGAYQNEMARITGIDSKFAGVFSKEYQTGNGLSVSEMKPEHALRFLMKKNPGAFEQFFNAQKGKKGFNPFSAGFLSQGMDFVLGKLTGETALKVGNNLERAGWGKANKGEDGKYTVQLTKDGAQNWSDSFNFDEVSIGGKPYKGFTSPAAIEKGGSKIYTFLESLGINDPKFAKQPVDLSNLMSQGESGGYFQGSDLVAGQTGQPFDPNTFDPMNPKGANLATLDPNLTTNVKFQPQYGYMPNTDLRGYDSIPGTPSNYNITDEGKIQNYPTYTPGGYKIDAYNPTRDYSERTNDYTRNNIGSGGGGQDPNQDTTTPPPGPLTFDVFGRPVTYDYSGGPEQIYLGGGYKRDGQYIGSPYGYSKGGIANFKPYGY